MDSSVSLSLGGASDCIWLALPQSAPKSCLFRHMGALSHMGAGKESLQMPLHQTRPVVKKSHAHHFIPSATHSRNL